jgi:hypothetical protein
MATSSDFCRERNLLGSQPDSCGRFNLHRASGWPCCGSSPWSRAATYSVFRLPSTKPERSECAENRPWTPACAQRSFTMSRTAAGANGSPRWPPFRCGGRGRLPSPARRIAMDSGGSGSNQGYLGRCSSVLTHAGWFVSGESSRLVPSQTCSSLLPQRSSANAVSISFSASNAASLDWARP